MIRNYTSDDETICSVDEQQEIIEWTKKYFNYFKNNGFNRYNFLLNDCDYVPNCIWDIKNRIKIKENLQNYKQ